MNNPLDLKRYIKNYFTVWLFRSVVVLIALLFFYTAYTNNFRNDFASASCPEDSFGGCLLLKNEITNNEHFPDEWDGVLLQPGETIGEKPNEDYFQFKSRVWLIILFAFILNHFLYMFKEKKLYPKEDIKELKKKLEELDK